jgi:mannose-6-phosphate isomerase-like protein (cupin superfamily)
MIKKMKTLIFSKELIDSPEMIAGDNTRLREILHPRHDQLAINYSIAYVRLAVGEASLPHRLKSGETYYILEGKAKLYVDKDEVVLKKNALAFVPPMALQFVENIGSEELFCLCIVQPEWREEDEIL